ncbi:hypothetical protein ACGFIY_21040 [Micromonospora chersina]|uniref:hypothetical protein n=1 Tax=Micromonospora chersina TaxID=47854 RepID=UPI0037180781
MSASDFRDQVPSRREAEQRAADESEARRDRFWNWVTGVVIALLVIALVVVVAALGGELS